MTNQTCKDCKCNEPKQLGFKDIEELNWIDIKEEVND
jgi:hypothetical protein